MNNLDILNSAVPGSPVIKYVGYGTDLGNELLRSSDAKSNGSPHAFISLSDMSDVYLHTIENTSNNTLHYAISSSDFDSSNVTLTNGRNAFIGRGLINKVR